VGLAVVNDILCGLAKRGFTGIAGVWDSIGGDDGGVDSVEGVEVRVGRDGAGEGAEGVEIGTASDGDGL